MVNNVTFIGFRGAMDPPLGRVGVLKQLGYLKKFRLHSNAALSESKAFACHQAPPLCYARKCSQDITSALKHVDASYVVRQR